MAFGEVVSYLRRGFLCALLFAVSGLPATSQTATVTYEYDAAGRLKNATYEDGTVVNYGLDPPGNRTSVVTTVPAPSPGTLALAVSSYTVGEGGGSVTITVSRTGGSSGTVGVTYATAPGSASAGSDYTATNGVLTWNNAEAASKTFNVPILQDGIYEGTESFNLTLSNPTGGAVLGNSSASVSITDDETPPPGSLQLNAASYSAGEGGGSLTVMVTRTGGSNGAASISYATANGSATAGSDYTATSGSLSWSNGDAATKSFSIPILQDGSFEGSETFTVNLSNASGASAGSPASATVTISDDENPPAGTLQFSAASYPVVENAGTVTITVTRTGGSFGAASVNYATAGSTATANVDYTTTTGTLNWANGDSASKTFTVPILPDGPVEGSEVFSVSLSGVSGATIGSQATASVVISEPSTGTLQLSASSYSIAENGGSLTVTVTRTGSNYGNVSAFGGTSATGNATAGTDYDGVSGVALSWSSGDAASKTFSVPVHTDALAEPSETFQVYISTPVGITIGSPSSATVTITDVDVTPPSAPGTPSFTSVTGTSATANWAAASDSHGVTGYRYRLAGGAWTVIGNVTSVALSGLTQYTSYSFEVQARDAAGYWSAGSSATLTTLDVTPPSAVGNLQVGWNGAVNRWTATWTAATDNVGIAEYRFSTNGGASWGSAGLQLYGTLDPLPDNSTYTVIVQARDAAMNWGPTSSLTFNTHDTIPPGTPGVPTFSSVTANSAVASWAAATDNFGVVEYFYILDTPAGPIYQMLGNVTSTPLSGLSDATSYTFRVAARDAAGRQGLYSSNTFTTLDGTPPQPPGTPQFSAITTSTATVTWTAASDNVGVTGYRYRVNAGSWTEVGLVYAANLTGLVQLSTYTVEVQARDAIGFWSASSSNSLTIADGTVPSAPGVPTISNITGSSASASWTAATDNVGVTGYRYSLNGGASWTNIGNVLSANLTGLGSGVSYTLLVQAGDAVGNWGPGSSAGFTTTDVVAPGAPGAPTFINVTSNSVTINWGPATDNVGVTGYRTRVNGAGPGGTAYGWYELAELSHGRSGLHENQTYTVEVQARDAAGYWGPSSSASFTTLNPPPAAPGDLSLFSTGPSTAQVSWTQYPALTDLAAYEYQINSGSWVSAGTNWGVTLTGLTDPSTFQFNLRARDTSGQYSSVVTRQFTHNYLQWFPVVNSFGVVSAAAALYRLDVYTDTSTEFQFWEYTLYKKYGNQAAVASWTFYPIWDLCPYSVTSFWAEPGYAQSSSNACSLDADSEHYGQ